MDPMPSTYQEQCVIGCNQQLSSTLINAIDYVSKSSNNPGMNIQMELIHHSHQKQQQRQQHGSPPSHQQINNNVMQPKQIVVSSNNGPNGQTTTRLQ